MKRIKFWLGICVYVGLAVVCFFAIAAEYTHTSEENAARKERSALYHKTLSEAKLASEGQIATVSTKTEVKNISASEINLNSLNVGEPVPMVGPPHADPTDEMRHTYLSGHIYSGPEWNYVGNLDLNDEKIEITDKSYGAIVGKVNGIDFSITTTVTYENGPEKTYETKVVFGLDGDKISATPGITVIQTKHGLATMTEDFFSGYNNVPLEKLDNPPEPVGVYLNRDLGIIVSDEQLKCIEWIAQYGDTKIPYKKVYENDDMNSDYKFIPDVSYISNLL